MQVGSVNRAVMGGLGMVVGACGVSPEDQLDALEAEVASNGLKATYFNNANFTSQKVQRVDATVDFDWGRGKPMSGVSADTFSVRWTGYILPSVSETFTFSTVSDDGVRLWIDGEKVIDDWTHHSAKENLSRGLSLSACVPVAVKLEYMENQGAALVRLQWQSASTAKAVIPSSALRTERPTTTTTPTEPEPNPEPVDYARRPFSATSAWNTRVPTASYVDDPLIRRTQEMWANSSSSRTSS